MRGGRSLRVVSGLAVFGAAIALSGASKLPSGVSGLAWAYPRSESTTFGQPLGPGPFHMPGSSLTLTRAEVQKAVGPIDWHPEDHPLPPAIVAGSVGAKVTPCAECHALNGAGFPGSADLAGLPSAYIVEQVMAFRSGERRSGDPGQPDTAEMIKVARKVAPDALKEAADYYAALPRPHWLSVAETTRAPRTVPDRYGWLDPAPGGGVEPLGGRVVELSDDLPRTFLDDDHVILRDYVPLGAIARGKRVADGAGGGIACRSCHGPELRGEGAAPPIAGRPAAYLARTLWDIRLGARRNAGVAPMRAVAGGLSSAQVRDLSAYLASLPS